MKWPRNITPQLVQKLIRAERDVHKAVLIFDSATAEYPSGYRHDPDTFSLIISRLLAANQFDTALHLLNRMRDENLDCLERVFLSFFKSYSRAHRPLDALRLFQKMREFNCSPSPTSYVSVFDALVSENQMKLAHRFYRFMRKMGVSHNLVAVNVLIKAFCKSAETLDSGLRVFREMGDHGYVADCYTYNTVINGLCSFGKVGEAKELMKEMGEKNCEPTVVTYSCLIHGLCRAGKFDEAAKLLDEMAARKIEPNVVTYSALIDALCKSGRSSQGLELLGRMTTKRLAPNMITYSSLVSGLCRESKIQDALEILDRMKLQGWKPDAGLYSKVVVCLCNLQRFREAANFLDEMILSGVIPNRVTRGVHANMHNMVVLGLCDEDDANRAIMVYQNMRAQGISAELGSCSALVDCLCKKGQVHKAAGVVSDLLHDGRAPDEFAWNAVVSGFWRKRKVQEAAELIQVELENSHIHPNLLRADQSRDSMFNLLG